MDTEIFWMEVYAVQTPNSGQKIDIAVKDQPGAKLFFRMNMNTFMENLQFEV